MLLATPVLVPVFSRPVENVDGGRIAGFVIGCVLALGAGGLLATLGVQRLVAWRRLGSFGRVPVGMAFGRSGIRFLTAEGDLFLRWERIDAVRANWMRLPVRQDDVTLPTIDVVTGSKRVRFRPDVSDVGGLVILTALTTFHQDASARAALGDGTAQRLFDGWVEQDARRRAMTRRRGAGRVGG